VRDAGSNDSEIAGFHLARRCPCRQLKVGITNLGERSSRRNILYWLVAGEIFLIIFGALNKPISALVISWIILKAKNYPFLTKNVTIPYKATKQDPIITIFGLPKPRLIVPLVMV
jgi:hypothetical protein